MSKFFESEQGEQSEQSELANLIQEDREVLNTSDMIWGSLRDNLDKIGDVKPEMMEKIKQEIENSGNTVVSDDKRRVPLNSKRSSKVTLPENTSTEKLLISLFEIHDGLINTFELSGIDSPISKNLIELISYMEDCIRYIGGTVDIFDPMKHVSGLDVPDFYKNAQKVIDTTSQCYKMGKVIDSSVEDNGNAIKIVFSGISKGVSYTVYGLVTSSSWNGNEAIDFIYTPGQGKMSVKVFEKGKWIDKSETGNYEIRWELEEIDMQESSELVEKNNIIEKNTSSINLMKEVAKEDKNKLIEIVESPDLDKEIGDFPIIDRQNEIHETNNNK